MHYLPVKAELHLHVLAVQLHKAGCDHLSQPCLLMPYMQVKAELYVHVYYLLLPEAGSVCELMGVKRCTTF